MAIGDNNHNITHAMYRDCGSAFNLRDQIMTMKQFLSAKLQWLRLRRHLKTVNETSLAVEAFSEWLGADVDIDQVSPKMVDEFEADSKSSRRRQLVSNLCGLLRLYDPQTLVFRNVSKTCISLPSFELPPSENSCHQIKVPRIR